MEEKKFLETIEDGELDIAAYARSWEEGDNVTVTCDLLLAMDQAVGVFNEQKAEIERLTEENGQIFDKIYDFIEFRQKRMVEPYKDALTYILRELKEEFGGKNETV